MPELRPSHLPARRGAEGDGSPYLRIGAAAQAVGVSPSALRLWERQHLVRPARTRAGYRLYSSEDIDVLRRIRRMRRDQVNAPGIRQLIGGGARGIQQGRPGPTDAGRRLRELRHRQGLSLREASRRAGISTSFLSSLERDAAGARLDTLQRLVSVYGVTVGDLFERPERPRRVVRRGQGHALELPEAGLRIEQLAESAQQLEPQVFVLAAGADSATAYAHPGEEFLYVLDGEVTFWVGDGERYRLRAGDALTFPSTLPHRWRNRATGESRLLWINTPPTF